MTTTAGFQLPALDDDGKTIVAPFPATRGWQTQFTGAGDIVGPPLQRGEGTRLRLTFTGPATQQVDIQWGEPVELHDGQAFYTPVASWGPDDLADVLAVLPASTTTPNGTSSGNCNRVPSGLGYDVIIPAAGDGAHDLVTAVPTPAPGGTGGYWDVSHTSGVVTPSATPGQAAWLLLSVEVQAALIKRLPLGHPLGVLDFDAYRVEWFHPLWLLRLRVTKVSAGAGEFAAWVLLFRERTT